MLRGLGIGLRETPRWTAWTPISPPSTSGIEVLYVGARTNIFPGFHILHSPIKGIGLDVVEAYGPTPLRGFFYYFDFLVGETVKLVDQLVDLAVGGFDFAA